MSRRPLGRAVNRADRNCVSGISKRPIDRGPDADPAPQVRGVLSNPYVEKGLRVLAAVTSAVHGYLDSTARTTGGKAANAALSGLGGAAVVSNPLVAAADLLLPHGVKPWELFNGASGAISTVAEGVVTGDTRGMDDFHKRSVRGDYGMVMSGYSQIGDVVVDPPSMEEAWGGVKEIASDLWNWDW